jgi:hypothetical protein
MEGVDDTKSCSLCTFINPKTAQYCVMCGVNLLARQWKVIKPVQPSDKVFSQESAMVVMDLTSELPCETAEESPPLKSDESIRPTPSVVVYVREVKILDQFGPAFKTLITKYNTPKSICGYASVAAAFFIAEAEEHVRTTTKARSDGDDDEKEEEEEKLKQFRKIIDMLNDATIFVEKVEAVIKEVQGQRAEYLKTHAHEEQFSNERTRSGYMTNWVALSEISDCMKRRILDCHSTSSSSLSLASPSSSSSSLSLSSSSSFSVLASPFYVHFVQGSQDFVEVPNVHWKKDEGASTEEATLMLRPTDWANEFQECGVWLKSNTKSGDMQNNEEQTKKKRTGGLDKVFIVDLLGHFAVMKGLYIRGQPTLLLINTTMDDYIERPIVETICRMLFLPSSSLS